MLYVCFWPVFPVPFTLSSFFCSLASNAHPSMRLAPFFFADPPRTGISSDYKFLASCKYFPTTLETAWSFFWKPAGCPSPDFFASTDFSRGGASPERSRPSAARDIGFLCFCRCPFFFRYFPELPPFAPQVGLVKDHLCCISSELVIFALVLPSLWALLLARPSGFPSRVKYGTAIRLLRSHSRAGERS